MDGPTVHVPRSIFGRPRQHGRDIKKKKKIMEMLLERESDINNLFRFKAHPTFLPDTTEIRPMRSCCDNCLTDSEKLIDEEVKQLGLIDCFCPPTQSSYNPLRVQMFPFFYHYQKECTFAKLYRIPTWNELENDENLLSLYPADQKESAKPCVLDVLRQLQVPKISSFILPMFISLSAWIWQKRMSGSYFESILVHEGQIQLLKKVHMKKLPIIYIPTNRSDWDITVIMWVLAHNGLPTPFFISNYDSSHKSQSAYYGGIGSALKVESTGVDSELKYSSAVSCYLRNLIRKQNNVAFNLEVNRSATGYPSARIYGAELLGIIYDEFQSQRIEDAYFVPVSVSYESRPEESVLRNMLYMKGNVKVDFAEPICLREFDKSLKKNPKVTHCAQPIKSDNRYYQTRDCSFLKWDSENSTNSVSALYGELAPLYPQPEEKLKAVVLDVMAYHLAYDARKCGSIMPIHLVAFLLMKKFQDGVYLDAFLTSLEWLVEVTKSNRNFAFAIRDTDMISIAFRGYLKNDITIDWEVEKKTYLIKPIFETENLKRLDYYANFLLSDFIMEGIVATAIFKLIGPRFNLLCGFNKEINIKDADLMEQCKKIYEVFTGTFLLNPPCLTSELAIRRQISAMSNAGHLSLVVQRRSKQKLAVFIDDDSDQDEEESMEPSSSTQIPASFGCPEMAFIPDEIKLLTVDETYEHLDFCRNLLVPYLEIYAFLSSALKILLEEDNFRMEMAKLENYLLNLLQKTDEILGSYPHMLTREIVKSFLATFDDNEIIYCQHDNDHPETMTRYYVLSTKSTQDGQRKLNEMTKRILQYVTK